MILDKRCLVFVFPVVVLSLFVGGCEDKNSHNGEPVNPERQVVVVRARIGSIAEVLRLTGTLFAAQDVEITSKLPGRVEKVLVDVGTRVNTGTVLIELEREELALAVAQAEAAVATAQAGLAKVIAGTRKERLEQAEAAVAQAKANTDICKVTFDRMTRLLADESIPRTKYDEAKARYDVAVAQHKAALAALEMARTGPTREDIGIVRAQVAQAKAALASTRRQYRNATITSPIAGVVAHRNVEPGEVVSPPMMPGRALLRIVDTSALKTKVHVSENRVKAVKLGQEAVITLDGFPDETFSGNVSRISPVVDSRSRTFEAEILIPNPDRRLKPGMFARVKLVLVRKTDVVKVPLKAVTKAEGGEVVFIAEDGTAKARPVTVGISDGADVEVVSGVNAGDKVIVRGNLGLEDGDRVVLKTSRGNQ